MEDGGRILSNVVSSQVELHTSFGGVVPELAARAHLERIAPVVDAALRDGGRSLDDVDLVAVTRGPGLVGPLLVGVGFAQALAMERVLPVVGVSHLDGHINSAFLHDAAAEAPVLVLIVSGGHTELVLVDAEGAPRVLGRTLDDAAGEAFDKVARMLGLRYPGGPEIDRIAGRGGGRAADFPLPRVTVDGLDFSFSGLKTAVRYRLEKELGLPQGGLERADAAAMPPQLVGAAAAAFQERAIDHLLEKLELAVGATTPQTVAVTGGVAQNRGLRARLAERFASATRLVIPPPELCTDNAAMIAAAGFRLWQRGEGASLEVEPGLRLSPG
ncbi:MAG: tRNA N6-adenosine threonylcarbamoyltransferase [Chloroflexota bacterium]|nr:tRNA N6-adenosine threonylcarbamoyltransferase [Chloroflexota bacterium]